MTNIAVHVPVHEQGRLTVTFTRVSRRLTVFRRFWRLRRFRRRRLACILAQVRDPQLLADIGIGPLPKTGLEDWPSIFVPQKW
jgi:hypothetical protein